MKMGKRFTIVGLLAIVLVIAFASFAFAGGYSNTVELSKYSPRTVSVVCPVPNTGSFSYTASGIWMRCTITDEAATTLYDQTVVWAAPPAFQYLNTSGHTKYLTMTLSRISPQLGWNSFSYSWITNDSCPPGMAWDAATKACYYVK